MLERRVLHGRGERLFINRQSGPYPLAEHWNGSAWMAQPTPAPAGSVDAELNGVSCLGLDHCVAVGHYRLSNGAVLPLAEAWHAGGGWTIQSAPEPAGQVGEGWMASRVPATPRAPPWAFSTAIPTS